MKSDVSAVFAQCLDFLPNEAVDTLSQKFMQRYSAICSFGYKQIPADLLGSAEAFLFEELRKLIRRDPSLDLRYPDAAIENLVLLLIDKIECTHSVKQPRG